MKELTIPFFPEKLLVEIATDINALDEFLAIQEIDNVPWKEYPYRPGVKFGLAHSMTSICLKFFVEERYLRSEIKEINGPVWEDSCVEFFIRFDDSGYYNFEFNCIGTALVGFGQGKSGRALLPPSLIDTLRIKVEHPRKRDENFSWQLAVLIPLNIFSYHSLTTLQGVNATANFYKCGDLTPEPHFLTWNFIEAEKPDFHRPEFFGMLHFSHSLEETTRIASLP